MSGYSLLLGSGRFLPIPVRVSFYNNPLVLSGSPKSSVGTVRRNIVHWTTEWVLDFRQGQEFVSSPEIPDRL
jgi:hypothetical protein